MHEVETMAYAGEVPWHGLGTRVEGPALTDAREMLRQAGLDWEVELAKLTTEDGTLVEDHFATRRVSDRRILGVVGDKYTVLQNTDAFAWFQPFVEAGDVEYHTAGSLRGGRRVWVLARVKGPMLEIRPGDKVAQFLMLSHGHDGGMCVRAGFSPIRVVCANTLKMAHADAGSALIRLKHTASIKANLDAVRETMDLVRQSFRATGEQYRRLAQKGINRSDVLKYVQIVFELPEVESDWSARSRNMIEKVKLCIAGGLGNTGESLWDAYNGVTEYLQHHRSEDNPERRMESAWFGQGSQVSERALKVALEMAA